MDILVIMVELLGIGFLLSGLVVFILNLVLEDIFNLFTEDIGKKIGLLCIVIGLALLLISGFISKII